MHTFLVALAYMAMVFAPCAVAQWGDVLARPFEFVFARSQRRQVQTLVFVSDNSFAANELNDLLDSAFMPPPALPAYAKAKTFAEIGESAPRTKAFEQASARVAARLAEMVQAHRLANTVVMAESAEAVMTAESFIETLAVRPENTFFVPQATENGAAPPRAGGVSSMHLLRRLQRAQDEDGAISETPPVSVAA